MIALAVLGVITSVGRVVAIANVAPRLTEARLAAARAFFPAHAAEVPLLEQRFADSGRVTLLHVVAGGSFLGLALLQFSPTIRRRHLRVHRWSGRVLVVLGFFAGLTGLWMGVVAPYSPTERLPTAFAGALFLIAPALAVAAVRRGDIDSHREWMIRFFAVGIGIVVIRLVGPLIIWLTSPAPFRDVIGLTFWAGWLLSIIAAEVWIRLTRPRLTVAAQVPQT